MLSSPLNVLRQILDYTFRKGLHVYLGCTEHIDCCAHCLLNALVQGRSGNIPLFQFSNGKSLSKNVFVNNTKLALSMLGFDHTKYSGHSYRSGAATSAAMAGLSDYEIKLLGRWSSNAYCRYIRTPTSLLTSFSKRIFQFHQQLSTT